MTYFTLYFVENLIKEPYISVELSEIEKQKFKCYNYKQPNLKSSSFVDYFIDHELSMGSTAA